MEVEHQHVAVVGSGPAGYTAAIYLARAGLSPCVFEGAELGGSLMTTSEVENFPGFDSPVLGPELMARMRTQAQRVGAVLVPEDVTAMHLDSEKKLLRTATGCYSSDAVILAMGSKSRMLGLEAESWALGNGLSTCATCDGFFFRDQPVAVVGGGDSALEEAVFLSNLASSVTVIHRGESFRASSILQERARERGVRFLMNHVVTDLTGEPTVTGLTTRTSQGAPTRMEVSALFVAIGQNPRTELIDRQVRLTGDGYVAVDHPTSHTSLPGVFACGDLVDSSYRQAVTAAGSGCVAALDAQRWLSGRACPYVPAGSAR